MNYPNQLNEGFVRDGRSDGADVFEGLDDLGNLAGLCDEGFSVPDGFSGGADFSGGYEDGLFLELRDLRSGDEEAQVPFDQFPTAFNVFPNPGESSYDRANNVDAWSDRACGLEDRDRIDPSAGAAQHRAQSSVSDINYGYQAPNFQKDR